jgi:hypothetical protein
MMRQALLVKLRWSLVYGPCAASEDGVDVPAGGDGAQPTTVGGFLARPELGNKVCPSQRLMAPPMFHDLHLTPCLTIRLSLRLP